MKIWENYLSVVSEKMKTNLNLTIESNTTQDGSMLNESKLNTKTETVLSHILPYDFIFCNFLFFIFLNFVLLL